MLTAIAGSLFVVSSLFVLWWALSGKRNAPVELGGRPVDTTDMRTLLLRQGATERVVTPGMERAGSFLRRLLPAHHLEQMHVKILRAGSPPGWTVERVLAAKVLLPVLLGLVFFLRYVSSPSVLMLVLTIGGVFFGYFLPDGLLDRRVESRTLTIRMEVADTIDQLAMMVRAGLGIDGAIARLARTGSGPLAEEFGRVVQEMRVGSSRGVALSNMAERTGVGELSSFTAALAQAERLGVPVAQTLEVQTKELRVRRHQLAEEQAMKLPVKILFPMVFCILPTLFIVLLGPAVISIFERF